MSLTAWVVETFFRKPEIKKVEQENVKTIEVPKTPSGTVHKVFYFRDSDYTYQDTISVNGVKISKGSTEQNLEALSTYLFLKHNFNLERSHFSRMSKLCSVGLNEQISLSNNVIIDLKITIR